MDITYTIQQVGQLLGINLPRVKNLINQGLLIGKLENGKTLISAESLTNLISSDEKYAHLADKVSLISEGTLPGITDVLDAGKESVTNVVAETSDVVAEKIPDVPDVTEVKEVVSEKIERVKPTIKTAKIEQPVAKIASNTTPEKKGGLAWLLPLIALLLIGGAVAWYFMGQGDDTTTDAVDDTVVVETKAADVDTITSEEITVDEDGAVVNDVVIPDTEEIIIEETIDLSEGTEVDLEEGIVVEDDSTEEKAAE